MQLPYERITSSSALHAVISLHEGEHLLVLHAFGWHLDGSHIPNAAEQFDRDSVCAEHHWKVVCEYGPYIAVVREMTELDRHIEEYRRMRRGGVVDSEWPISRILQMIDGLIAERDGRDS